MALNEGVIQIELLGNTTVENKVGVAMQLSTNCDMDLDGILSATKAFCIAIGIERNSAIQEISGLIFNNLLDDVLGLNVDEENNKSKSRKMTANEYQMLAARTIDQTMSRGEQEYHALHGMVGEVGELHSIYQKAYQGHNVDKEHQKKELGDLLWFIAEYCTAKDWKLEDVMRLNIEKLQARYPNGFEVEKSLHRKNGDV